MAAILPQPSLPAWSPARGVHSADKLTNVRQVSYRLAPGTRLQAGNGTAAAALLIGCSLGHALCIAHYAAVSVRQQRLLKSRSCQQHASDIQTNMLLLPLATIGP